MQRGKQALKQEFIEVQRHAGRQRIMRMRQALRQMVRQRDKPGIGWRQACTKPGRKAKQ
jgi:hypothetical protein